jgi:hypothetical protein
MSASVAGTVIMSAPLDEAASCEIAAFPQR